MRTLNPHLIRAQYAVRGELAIRAEQLKEVSRFSHPIIDHSFQGVANVSRLVAL